MNIVKQIENELSIYCDDHIDVERIDNDCFITMENCIYTSENEMKPIIENINQFGMIIVSIDIDTTCGDECNVNIHTKMSDWLMYQDEILKKHERYIRRKRGLPLGPRPNKKNYHRIIKGGFTRNGKQQYIIINSDGKRIECSIDKNKLEKRLKIIRHQSLEEKLKYWPFGLLLP